MNLRSPWIIAGLAVGAASLASVGAGCELIASVDRSLIGAGGTGGTGTGGAGGEGGEATTGGGMGGTGGMGGAGGGTGGMGGMPGTGGMGGMPGTGGMGGMPGTGGGGGAGGGTGGAGGGAAVCNNPGDCPATGNECVMATCNGGMCGTADVNAGTPTATQTAGDCRQVVCDGNGATMMINDASDIQNDNLDCTVDTCMNGTPVHTPASQGTACNDGGGTMCNASGACVECNANTDCASGMCYAGACVASINGCDIATAVDITATPTIAFGGANGNNYVEKCSKVSAGTMVTFNGSFMFHNLQGGAVNGGVGTPATSGPFVPATTTGTTATFTMSTLGTYPFYCVQHQGQNMSGVVFVVP